jgi:hypothetical protein
MSAELKEITTQLNAKLGQKTVEFWSTPFHRTKATSFYQDRLGTNAGKARKQNMASAFLSRRHVVQHDSAQQVPGRKGQHRIPPRQVSSQQVDDAFSELRLSREPALVTHMTV